MGYYIDLPVPDSVRQAAASTEEIELVQWTNITRVPTKAEAVAFIRENIDRYGDKEGCICLILWDGEGEA